MTEGKGMASVGRMGRSLTKPVKFALGRRTSATFKTPAEDMIVNGWFIAHEKNASSIKRDTSADGVELWKAKNLSA
jgi:hypothetical protein